MALALAAATLLLGASCGPGQPPGSDAGPGPATPEPSGSTASSGPPSILLISLDTTRADRLGCYGYEAASTPTLDRWAAEGTVFEHAVTPTPVTLPAHATLLTGLFPQRHGVRDNGLYRLGEEIATLAGVLAERGWVARAVVGAAVLDRQYGLDRGFESWDDRMPGAGGLAIAERSAGQVTDAALRAVEEIDGPFLLFVHYFDPHADYRPPVPYARRAPSPYDGEISYVDDELRRLRDGLQARGLLDDTIVAIVADHGEGLGEHGEATHGVFLYQSTLRVPWVVWSPARVPAGRRVATLASLADVMPTLLDLAGLDAPPGLDGRSQASSWNGASEAGPRWVPLESEFGFNSYGWAPLRGLTDARVKWIDAPRPELYDLRSDPHEQRNLAATRADELRRLEDLRASLAPEDHRAPPPGARDPREQAELLSELSSLGYVKASRRQGIDAADLPDPKDVIGTLALINEARGHLSAGRPWDAVPSLQAVLERSPDNLSALVLLGSAFIEGGQPARAEAPLSRAAALAPHNADVHFNRGLARMGAGDLVGAEAAWRETLRVAPRYEQAAGNLIDMLLWSDRLDDAADLIAEARSADLDGPVLDYLEGRLALRRGDRQAARRLLRRALDGPAPPAVAADARRLLGTL